MSFSSDPALLINQLPISLDLPEDPQKFREEVELFTKRTANILNTKTGALYSGQEYSNSEVFNITSPTMTSNVYRKCFDLVALNGGVNIPGGGVVSFPHGITGLLASALIYASCTSTDPFYFSVMGYPNIYLTSTNVVFTNPLPATPLRAAYAIAEYIKS
jgi:hypothetical protein